MKKTLIKKLVITAAVCAAAVAALCGCGSKAWQNNVMSADFYSSLPEFKTYRSDIRSITFLNTLRNAPENAVDISENQDGSVMMWVENNGPDPDSMPDNEIYRELNDVYIAGKGGVKAPDDCSSLFDGYSYAESINFNGNFHTDDVTDMSSMFEDCEVLTELNLKGFKTSNVTDMSRMFKNCKSLKNLDLKDFKTSNVTDMNSIFEDCKSLTTINLKSFDTSNVTNMSDMFENCVCLTALDLSKFDFLQVEDIGYMFYGCKSLTDLKMGSSFSTKLEDAFGVFNECDSLPEDVTEKICQGIEDNTGIDPR